MSAINCRVMKRRVMKSRQTITINSIQPVSACLPFFEAIWHFFTSGLAFFSLGPGNPDLKTSTVL